MRILLDPAVTTSGSSGAAAITAAPVQATVEKKEPAAATATPAPTSTTSAPAAEKAPWMGESKPAASEPAKPAAEEAKPKEKFNLKAPEGVKVEAAVLEKFGAEMQALGLSEEQAQKLYLRNHEAEKASHTQILSQLDKQDADWLGELKGLWGDKYAENGEKLKRVYDYIDPDRELRSGLEAMRMAHNPKLNKAMARLIPLFEEPKLKPPSAAGVIEKDSRTPQEKLAAQFRAELAKGAAVPGGMKIT